MKRVRITMEYTGRASEEFEVPDDWELRSFEDLTIEMLKELDASLVEMSPSDWSAKDA